MFSFEFLGIVMMFLGFIITFTACCIDEFRYLYRETAAYVYVMYVMGFIILFIGFAIALIFGTCCI